MNALHPIAPTVRRTGQCVIWLIGIRVTANIAKANRVVVRVGKTLYLLTR